MMFLITIFFNSISIERWYIMFDLRYPAICLLFFLASSHFIDLVHLKQQNILLDMEANENISFKFINKHFVAFFFLNFAISGISIFIVQNVSSIIIFIVSQLLVVLVTNLAINENISYKISDIVCLIVNICALTFIVF